MPGYRGFPFDKLRVSLTTVNGQMETARATATANTGVLRFAQDDDGTTNNGSGRDVGENGKVVRTERRCPRELGRGRDGMWRRMRSFRDGG